MAGAVDWIPLTNDAVEPGDRVSVAAGVTPVFDVVALEDGKAWLRDGEHDVVRVLALDHFHWKLARG